MLLVKAVKIDRFTNCSIAIFGKLMTSKSMFTFAKIHAISVPIFPFQAFFKIFSCGQRYEEVGVVTCVKVPSIHLSLKP